MKRVIFDTNVYGKLITEPDFSYLKNCIISDKNLAVYGYLLIRKELRDIPKQPLRSKQTRILLLGLYDDITKGKMLRHSQEIVQLAESYCMSYKRKGGIYGWKTNIKVDFMLVACAALHGLDVVISDDTKTLGSCQALKAYSEVNRERKIRTPSFLTYTEFSEKLRNQSSTL